MNKKEYKTMRTAQKNTTEVCILHICTIIPWHNLAGICDDRMGELTLPIPAFQKESDWQIAQIGKNTGNLSFFSLTRLIAAGQSGRNDFYLGNRQVGN